MHKCPLCQSERWRYLARWEESEFQRCRTCGLVHRLGSDANSGRQDAGKAIQEGRSDGAVVLTPDSGLQASENPVDELIKLGKRINDRQLVLTLVGISNLVSGYFFGHWSSLYGDLTYYLDTHTATVLLKQAGFSVEQLEYEQVRLSLEDIAGRLGTTRSAPARALALALKVVPLPLRQRLRFTVRTGNLVVTAVKSSAKKKPMLSIVMPVYNEVETVAGAIERVLDKELDGLEKELIVVESKSSDGTREVVKQFSDHDDVKIVLQNEPRGKGNAVREGFSHTQGDIILIQDADDEYDVNDYDELIEPLVSYRTSFVLGSRHGGDWKLREFTDQPLLAAFMNLGHIFFTSLLNLLYRQRLQDPFTMFKVFRRECIQGLDLECDRFDFDHELVAKLVRRGYTPLEVPVNYRARSYSQGKKVSVLRDPLTWLRALLKYRFTNP